MHRLIARALPLLLCASVPISAAGAPWQASVALPVQRLIAVGDKVVALTDEQMVCFDVATGRRLAVHPLPGDYDRTIPLAADGVVVTAIGSAGVIAFDPCSNRVRWAHLFPDGVELAVFGDAVYVAAGASRQRSDACGGTITRIVLATGELQWQWANHDCHMFTWAWVGSDDTHGYYRAETRPSKKAPTENQLHAFDLATGRPSGTVPTLGSTGTIRLGRIDPEMIAIKWHQPGNWKQAALSRQAVFAMSEEGLLTAFAVETGAAVWRLGAFGNTDFVVAATQAGEEVLVLADDRGSVRAIPLASSLPVAHAAVEGRVRIHDNLPEKPLVIQIGAAKLVVGSDGRFAGAVEGAGRLPVVPTEMSGYEMRLCRHWDFVRDQCDKKTFLNLADNHRLELDLIIRPIDDSE